MMEGANLYWDAKNEAGGICGRQVELKVQDTGYDPQKAVAAYQQMSGDVVGLGLVLGSSITSALLPSVEQEGMFLNFAGWTSDILPNENVAIAGTTYDIEAINAVDFLMKRARASRRATRSATCTSRATTARTRSRAPSSPPTSTA